MTETRRGAAAESRSAAELRDGAEIDDGAAALAALRSGGKPSLARALSRLESRSGAAETLALLDAAWAAPLGPAIALTGPPGVGKSTLIDALIRAQRAQGGTIGVIAVDPSSSRTGGALLGDRTRLSTDPEDDGVFVRSMAARDRLGGLADHAYPASVLMRATRDLTLIETVGVGQSETDAAEIADAAVFCVQPASGDSLQFMKAGVMEIPDLVLVTKADLGEIARRAAADAAGALSLAARDGPPPPVRLVSAAEGPEGRTVREALEAMAAIALARRTRARRAAQVEAHIRQGLKARFGTAGLAALGPLAPLEGAALDKRPFTWAARAEARLAETFEALAARWR
ncbi:MAG: methylmalonyl Co-A mutase-associated GTPase MeaB [Pseudomonadota bacterium]